MVSYFDHATGSVPRPTLLLDKHTPDAHDNPVISIDGQGYVWIFSMAHGDEVPAYIHRSKKPYDVDAFEQIHATRQDGIHQVPIDNFSYMQPFYDPQEGFLCLFTRYNYPARRVSCFMHSRDGVHWSEWNRLAMIGMGHYQIGAFGQGKLATMMNYHPDELGSDWRTNLYYMESLDRGAHWQSVDGHTLALPLTTISNAALVHDYAAEKQLVYLKDLQFDANGRPILLYLTSRGPMPGPANGPRTWRIARWTGSEWKLTVVTTSDSNYDMGSLYVESDDVWRIIAPTEPGPQSFGAGGELVMWKSVDQGETWFKDRQLTVDSLKNQSYARRPVNAHKDFYAFWADGDARQPSESSLYFCNKDGDVFRLPRQMTSETAKPELVR